MPAWFSEKDSILKTKQGGIIEHFTTFDEVASNKQKERMEGLKKQIKSLSTNPLSDLNVRMDIAKKIVELRLKAGATVTAEMVGFNDIA